MRKAWPKTGPLLGTRNRAKHGAIRMVGNSLGGLGCSAIFMMISEVCWHLRLIAIIAACSIHKVAMDGDFNPDIVNAALQSTSKAIERGLSSNLPCRRADPDLLRDLCTRGAYVSA